MIVHGYTADGAISVTIDDVIMTVPDDMENRHRCMIAKWEEAGNTIPAHSPSTVATPPLTPRQLWLAALTAGITKEGVLQQIAAIPDPEEREWLRIEIQEATSFVRTHPAVDMLTTMIGMPEAQIDALWFWAATL